MKRRGFSLVEMLCVFALLALAGLILSLLLRDTLAIERVQTTGFDQMLLRNALADRFRNDVARAQKTLDESREYRAGPDTLILDLGNDRQVVYHWHDNKLQRATFGEDADLQTVPVGKSEVRVEFTRGDANPGLIRLRLIALHNGLEIPGRAAEIDAALGRDLR